MTTHPVSCLGKPTDREAWQAAVHGVTKESDTTQQLNLTLGAKVDLAPLFIQHPSREGVREVWSPPSYHYKLAL